MMLSGGERAQCSIGSGNKVFFQGLRLKEDMFSERVDYKSKICADF